MIDKDFQQQIGNSLTDFFRKQKKIAEQLDPRLGGLVAAIASLTLRGGDRMRPYVCYLGYQVGGGESLSKVLPMLMALELFHSFALIHDDIMDEASVRRGGPTIHAQFTQNLRNQQIATSTAILAGDLSLIWSQRLFERVDPDEPTRKLFYTLQEEVMYGQTLDVWGMKGLSRERLLAMYKLKTGNYGIQKPLLLGAMFGGTPQSTVRQLSSFGEKVGLAFQLQDDLLGVFGEEAGIGKSTTSDITQGKWTPLVAHLWKKLSNADKARAQQILGNPHAAKRDIDWFKNQLVDSGARAQIEKDMQELVIQATRVLTHVPQPTRKKLVDLAQFAIERTH